MGFICPPSRQPLNSQNNLRHFRNVQGAGVYPRGPTLIRELYKLAERLCLRRQPRMGPIDIFPDEPSSQNTRFEVR
jgi:hypothetical protein